MKTYKITVDKRAQVVKAKTIDEAISIVKNRMRDGSAEVYEYTDLPYSTPTIDRKVNKIIESVWKGDYDVDDDYGLILPVHIIHKIMALCDKANIKYQRRWSNILMFSRTGDVEI